MFKICYLHSIICGPFYPEAVNGLARVLGLLLPSYLMRAVSGCGAIISREKGGEFSAKCY